MELRLTLFFVLLMSLRTCVSGSPVQRRSIERSINWGKCKNNAIALNQLARNFSLHMTDNCNMSATITDDMKIEAGDLCDPVSISQAMKGFELKKSKCLQTMTGVLKNFFGIFGPTGLFQTNGVLTQMATEVNTVVTDLLSILGEKGDQKNLDGSKWKLEILRCHSVERLFSFSILASRVFSFVNNPEKSGTESVKLCH